MAMRQGCVVVRLWRRGGPSLARVTFHQEWSSRIPVKGLSCACPAEKGLILYLSPAFFPLKRNQIRIR